MALDAAEGTRVEVAGGLRKRTARSRRDPKLRLVVYYLDNELIAGPCSTPLVPALQLAGIELATFWALVSFPTLAAESAKTIRTDGPPRAKYRPRGPPPLALLTSAE